MKKIFLIVLGAFILSTSVSAQKLVPLTLNNEDDQLISTGNLKSPTLAPTVYIEDYMLMLEANHPYTFGKLRIILYLCLANI